MRWFEKFAQWCVQHDRYRVLGDDDGIYLVRHFIMWKKRPSWFPINTVLHAIWRSDRDGFHDHPWWSISIILWGGYWENQPDGRYWRGPGSIRFRRAKDLHWLELEPGAEVCWTLFVMGPRQREWGFTLSDGSWVHWAKYLRDKQTGV